MIQYIAAALLLLLPFYLEYRLDSIDDLREKVIRTVGEVRDQDEYIQVLEEVIEEQKKEFEKHEW